MRWVCSEFVASGHNFIHTTAGAWKDIHCTIPGSKTCIPARSLGHKHSEEILHESGLSSFQTMTAKPHGKERNPSKNLASEFSEMVGEGTCICSVWQTEIPGTRQQFHPPAEKGGWAAPGCASKVAGPNRVHRLSHSLGPDLFLPWQKGCCINLNSDT